jgi:hypothetical protein
VCVREGSEYVCVCVDGGDVCVCVMEVEGEWEG